jgi:two-component system response regulator RegX3
MSALTPPRILLVDDEAPVRQSLSFAFAREGYEVEVAGDGPGALAAARASPPDAVVLDLRLPGLDGLEVCRELRRGADVGIVMLTARDQGEDALRGFESGADDYVTKPFSTRELIARTRAVLRRRAQAETALRENRELLARIEGVAAHLAASYEPPRCAAPAPADRPRAPQAPAGDGLELDPSIDRATLHGVHLALAAHEFRILAALVARAGRVLTRTELIAAAWGAPSEAHRPLLEACIRVLQAKLHAADPSGATRITPVPGIGYTYG